MTRRTAAEPRSPAKRDARALVRALDRALREAGVARRAAQEKAYLKSPLVHYGASVPAIRGAVHRELAREADLTRTRLLAVVRSLWKSPIHEHRMAAVTALEERVDLLGPDDLALLERMIAGSFTWAYVDGLAASVAGALVERHPGVARELDRWASDESFWVRRGALLALLLPLRRGEGDWRRFVRYADAMLGETEFFIRKAIGWVLRETSKRRPERVRRYVAARLERMSGLTFREATKRLPAAQRRKLERARRARLEPRA
jgi:3-methyladenine DNA glycosylase AlkD